MREVEDTTMSTLFPKSQGTSKKRTVVEHENYRCRQPDELHTEDAMVQTPMQQNDILLYAINDVNSSTL
jgi:hypothetical protein